ncbi:MAG: Clp protease ClpP [Clostridia bacterium]|nr:Clp protease ClpP [Clostridia bacterium]
MPKKFWTIRAAQDEPNVGELLLYGYISDVMWWGDEVAPKQFKADLDALGDVSEIKVYINSGGGDVFAGQAIHSMLKRHKAKIIVYVDGLAASIASVVAMAGDTVIMPRNAMMMIHDPWTIAVGNAKEFRKLADDLEKIGESIVVAYEDKTGMDREKIVELLDAETWMTAEEAVEMGFADQLEEEKAIAASINGGVLTVNGQTVDLSKFKNAPKLAFIPPTPKAREDPPPPAGPELPTTVDSEPDLEPEPTDIEPKEEQQTDNGLLSLCQYQIQVNKNRLGGIKSCR